MGANEDLAQRTASDASAEGVRMYLSYRPLLDALAARGVDTYEK